MLYVVLVCAGFWKKKKPQPFYEENVALLEGCQNGVC
jgi:hypothetical protein